MHTTTPVNPFVRFFRGLGSLKIAVVLLLMLAAILATATYYESAYDTKTAQHLVYRSPFFEAFLALLFANVFCSTMTRFPWKRHQLGFVVTHLGILILLSGSFITMMTGIDGSMALQAGQTSSRAMLDEPVFFVGHTADKMTEVPADFRWKMPSQTRPARVSVLPGLTAVVDRYYHHASVQTRYVDDPGSAVAALQLRIYNSRVDVAEWLTLGKGDLVLGPARVSLQKLANPSEVRSFLEQKHDPKDRGELQLLLAGKPYRLSLSQLPQDRWVDIPSTDFHVRLNHYYSYAYVEPHQKKLVNRSEETVNPAVELDLRQGQVDQQRWLLFARLPQLNTRMGSHGADFQGRLLYVFDAPDPKQHTLTLATTPDNHIYYRVDQHPGAEATVGKSIPTGWMDLQFSVLQFVPQAREQKDYSDVKVEGKSEQDGPAPAIRVSLEGSPKPGPYWLERGDVIQAVGPNNDTIVFGYGFRSIDIGFNIQLKDFHIDYDPGTQTPAAFKSTVTVDNKDSLIEMNEPLVRNNLRFFQASYGEINGEPAISVLQVARDPGIGAKYLGSILLVLGIAIMFYMRPYQLKNRKQPTEERVRPNAKLTKSPVDEPTASALRGRGDDQIVASSSDPKDG